MIDRDYDTVRDFPHAGVAPITHRLFEHSQTRVYSREQLCQSMNSEDRVPPVLFRVLDQKEHGE